MQQLALNLCNDLIEAVEIPDPKQTMSCLKQFNMEWCETALYSMRNQLAIQYIKSIEDGICFEYKNYIDIDEFCVNLIGKIKEAEAYFNREADWKQLIVFCERFACIKRDNIMRDISYKHWRLSDIEILNEEEFKEELYQNLKRHINI